MCVTSLGRAYEKMRKCDFSIRESFNKNVSQIGLGSHRPHGTIAGLVFVPCIIRRSRNNQHKNSHHCFIHIYSGYYMFRQ
jgi:hypothetical protein